MDGVMRFNDTLLDAVKTIKSIENYILQCTARTVEETEMIEHFNYWVGGVAVKSVSIIGILLNIVAIRQVIPRLSTQHIFNHLIVTLFAVDAMCLIIAIAWSSTQKMGWNIEFLIIMFPKFTHPLSQIVIFLSIFMTVGISHERYVAIKSPITHRQKMLSAKFRRITLMKYLLPIFFFAVSLNVNKYFELELNWKTNTKRYMFKSINSITKI